VAGLAYSTHGTAQANKPLPATGPQPVSDVAPVPANYTTDAAVNYVKIRVPHRPLKDVIDVQSLISYYDVIQTINYYDGLGRPLQTIKRAQSADSKDIVTPFIYDQDGREVQKYLPYRDPTNNGFFKANVFTEQQAFMNRQYPNEQVFYEKTEFDGSPLNREVKIYSAGNSWASRPIEYQYKINTAMDSVRMWSIESFIPVSSGTYAPGQLTKKITIDEHGKQLIEFRDKSDKLVLRKVQLAALPGTAHMGWLCTYYVYDNRSQMRFVISPLAVNMIKGAWKISETVANELCFQYLYDTRQRLVMKNIPGSGRFYMVYDARNRLTFTQDSIQRKKSPLEWGMVSYDGLNRPTMTGIYSANISRESLQEKMDLITISSPVVGGTSIPKDLVVDTYDGSAIITASASVTLNPGFETTTGANIEIFITSTQEVPTVTNPLPDIPGATVLPMTFTFYDNYDYPGKLSFVSADTGRLKPENTEYPTTYYDRRPVTTAVKGLLTGTKVRVLGTDKWLTTSTYYNDKNRIIQVVNDNHLGGTDVSTTLYNFDGAVLSNYVRHQNPRSLTPNSTLLTRMTYDNAGRLVTVRKILNDDDSQERTISSSAYNDLGQLKVKKLGLTSNDKVIDVLNYSYNIRGWLEGINKDFVNGVAGASNWFGEEIKYDYGFESNQYNGNIAGVKWRSAGNPAYAYGYSYDISNRLAGAYFTEKNGENWIQDKKDFSVTNLDYDENGNIKTMLQKGMVGASSKTIDDLTYTYNDNSNRLKSVSDIDPSVTKEAKLGDFLNNNTTANDYSYDGNGNLTADLNKKITSITYNHLNLPDVITVDGRNTITYQYDANGRKLKKTVLDNTGTTPVTTTYDYAGAFVYKRDSLELISHEEGRIRPIYKTGAPVTYVYDYFEKDHLDNIRTVLTEQTDFSMYVATMETESAAKEVALFSNVDETRAEKPVGYPEDKTTEENKFVAKLNAQKGEKVIGPSIVLRVMKGDTVKINVRAFYKSQAPVDNGNRNLTEDMIAGLARAFGSSLGEDGVHSSEGITYNTPFNTEFYNNNYQRLKEKNTDNGQGNRVKGYLNYILFDDDFKLVDNNSGVKQVKASPDELQTLAVNSIVAEKTGFLYVYTSNESAQDIMFDNLVLAVNSGPLIEETHYYPFGLTMAGISSTAIKSVNYAENRLKYNGKELQSKEFEDGSGLELYNYGKRMQDPQLGRWHSIDSLTEAHYEASPYAYVVNDPVKRIDINGLIDGITIFRGAVTTLSGALTTAGGIAAFLAPTGVTQVGGGILISTGIPTTGLGIAMIIEGIKKDHASGNIPGGVIESVGMGVDKVVQKINNDKTIPGYGRLTGEWMDLAVGLKISPPKTVIDAYSTAGVIGFNLADFSQTLEAAVNQNGNNMKQTQPTGLAPARTAASNSTPGNVKVGKGVKAPDAAQRNINSNLTPFLQFGSW